MVVEGITHGSQVDMWWFKVLFITLDPYRLHVCPMAQLSTFHHGQHLETLMWCSQPPNGKNVLHRGLSIMGKAMVSMNFLTMCPQIPFQNITIESVMLYLIFGVNMHWFCRDFRSSAPYLIMFIYPISYKLYCLVLFYIVQRHL